MAYFLRLRIIHRVQDQMSSTKVSQLWYVMLQASRGEGRESGAVSIWYSPHSAELDVVYKEKFSDIHTSGEDHGETVGETSQLHRGRSRQQGCPVSRHCPQPPGGKRVKRGWGRLHSVPFALQPRCLSFHWICWMKRNPKCFLLHSSKSAWDWLFFPGAG